MFFWKHKQVYLCSVNLGEKSSMWCWGLGRQLWWLCMVLCFQHIPDTLRYLRRKKLENPLNNLRSLPRTVHLDFFLHWYLRPQPQPFPLRTNSIPPIPTILVIPLISMQKSLHYHYHYYYYNYPYSSSYHIYHR
jgi:hypothetical protein